MSCLNLKYIHVYQADEESLFTICNWKASVSDCGSLEGAHGSGSARSPQHFITQSELIDITSPDISYKYLLSFYSVDSTRSSTPLINKFRDDTYVMFCSLRRCVVVFFCFFASYSEEFCRLSLNLCAPRSTSVYERNNL